MNKNEPCLTIIEGVNNGLLLNHIQMKYSVRAEIFEKIFKHFILLKFYLFLFLYIEVFLHCDPFPEF